MTPIGSALRLRIATIFPADPAALDRVRVIARARFCGLVRLTRTVTR
jgi:hypothetical protein